MKSKHSVLFSATECFSVLGIQRHSDDRFYRVRKLLGADAVDQVEYVTPAPPYAPRLNLGLRVSWSSEAQLTHAVLLHGLTPVTNYIRMTVL